MVWVIHIIFIPVSRVLYKVDFSRGNNVQDATVTNQKRVGQTKEASGTQLQHPTLWLYSANGSSPQISPSHSFFSLSSRFEPASRLAYRICRLSYGFLSIEMTWAPGPAFPPSGTHVPLKIWIIGALQKPSFLPQGQAAWAVLEGSGERPVRA